MNKFKTGDKVVVMRGKDKGKSGEILRLVLKEGSSLKAVIAGVNIVKKAQKPNPQLGLKGGLIEIEKPIDVSNIMVQDPKSGKPTRVGFKVDEKGKKVRFAKKSGELI